MAKTKTYGKNNKSLLQAPAYVEFMVTVALLIVVAIPIIFAPKYLYDMYDLTKATALRFAFIMIVVAWAIKIATTKRMDWRRTPLDLPILAFMLMLILTTFTSQNMMISLVGGYKRHEGVITWFMYLVLFFTATNWIRSRWQVTTLMIPLFMVTTLMSIYGICQHYGIDFLQFGSQYDIKRSFATSGNPVFLGGFLGFIVPMMVIAFMNAKDYIVKGIFAVMTVLTAVCLAFTMTRGGWMGCILGLLVMAPFIPRKVYKENIIWLGALAVVVVMATVYMFGFVQSEGVGYKSTNIVTRLQEIVQLKGSAGTRAEMWKTSSFMIVKRPLQGIGLENYKDFFPQNRTLRLIEMEGEMAMPDRPHNEFFYLPSVIGLPGFMTYLWVIAAFLLYMARCARRIDDRATKMLMIGSAGAAVAYWIQCFFAFSMVVISPVFWLMAGAAVGMGAAKIREEKRLVPISISSIPVAPALASSLLALVIVVSILLSAFAVNAVRADAMYFQGIAAQSMNAQFAVQSWEQAVQLNPTLNLYRLMLASGYQRMSTETDRTMADKALAVYNDSTRFDPNDEDILVGLGDLNQYIGYQFKDNNAVVAAESAYKRAIEVDPNFTHALIALARIYLNRGDAASAEPLLKKASTVATPERSLETWKGALVGLSYVFAQRGDFATARQYVDDVLSRDPNDQSAKDQLKKLDDAVKQGNKGGGTGAVPKK